MASPWLPADLIPNKLKPGRPQDWADVEAIREADRAQREKPGATQRTQGHSIPGRQVLITLDMAQHAIRLTKTDAGIRHTTEKLTVDFQRQFIPQLIFDESVFQRIDPTAKLHEETKGHPLSSCAACLNVIGSMANDPAELTQFLGSFGLEIEELYEFPSPVCFEGLTYRDKGYAIFEWIGPKDSPINEKGGGRGQNRTSVDAFVLARIKGKITQLLIEWKFTEGFSRELALGRFCGGKGIERLKRYSLVLADLRKRGELPFDFEEEYRTSSPKSRVGIYDFSPDHLYQLLRMTLLAKMTTGRTLGKYTLEDYRVVHLTHSQNERVNILQPEYLEFSPGLQRFSKRCVHDVWKELLSARERERFICGHWDTAIRHVKNDKLRLYLAERYA